MLENDTFVTNELFKLQYERARFTNCQFKMVSNYYSSDSK